MVRQKTGVVLGQPAAQKAGVDHAPEESLLVVVRETLESLGRDLIDGFLLGRSGQIDLVI